MMLSKIALFLLISYAPQMAVSRPDSRDSGEVDARLQVTVQDYQLAANDFVDALTRVASDFQLPMGIEWVNTPNARTKVRLSLKNATVQQILQAIISGQPGYKMVVERGIVHVFASMLIPDRENPLKLNIEAFEVHNVPVEFASRELHNVVKRTISPPKLEQGAGGVAGSGFSSIDDPRISARVKNAPVENALDALAVSSARKIWIVTFADNPTLTTAGFRRTLTLWNNSPIPDTDQPLWDLLHWGDALPSAVLDGE